MFNEFYEILNLQIILESQVITPTIKWLKSLTKTTL